MKKLQQKLTFLFFVIHKLLHCKLIEKRLQLQNLIHKNTQQGYLFQQKYLPLQQLNSIGLMHRLLASIIVLLLCMATTHAQLPILRNFTTLDYKAGTQNWAIDQTDDGTMCFANNNGMLTFDGDKWKVWPMPNFTNVRSVQYDKATQRIYVAATNEFGYFDGNSQTHQYRYISISDRLPKKSRTFGEIWKILVLGRKRAFQAKNQVFIVGSKGNVKTVNVPHRIENASSIAGKLYISCLECVYEYSNGRLKPLPGMHVLKGKAVRAMLPYGQKILIATANNGLYLYNGETCRPYLLDISQALVDDQVFCAAATRQYIAFGTVRAGLIVKELATGRNYFINNITGLSNNTVLSIKFDNLGNMWLGLDNGISYIMPAAPCRDLLGANASIGTGYASLLSGNLLYLGTNQGLYVTHYPLFNNLTQQKPVYVDGITGQIWSIGNIDGHLLCGGDQGAYSIVGNKATLIANTQGTWGFLPIKGHQGYVLSCDYNGFVILKQQNDGYTMQNRVSGINFSTGGCIADSDGSLWMSHWQRGVYHFKLNNDLTRIEILQYFNKGNQLPADDNNLVCEIDGKVYISSADGFRRYNPATRRLEKAKNIDRIFNEYGVALRIIETQQGDLWAYKPGYLAIARRLARGRYRLERFTMANVVDRLQMSLGHPGALGPNLTLMNYENGFYLLNNHFTATRQSADVFIRSIYSTNRQDTLLYSNYPGPQETSIKIPHSLNSLRIEYVLPEYQEEKAVDYSYYLEGYDEHWSAPSTATSKEYTQLPKGNYTFHVKAHDRINDVTREAAFKIHVQPAWYETWWAYLLYLIVAGIAIMQLLKHMKRRTDKKVAQVQMAKEQEMRAKEAQFQIEEEKKEKELIKLRNEHLEIELKHKSSELADSTMNLVRKNDMLQEIDMQMDQLATEIAKEKNKAAAAKIIRDVRRSIQRNIKDDDNWEKFEENFNLVYDNFLDKLVSEFPLLKLNDRKLCAYLKMELSSKEMAALLNTSVRSVETARYRLRKKLNLEQGENLTNFIKNFDNKQNTP